MTETQRTSIDKMPLVDPAFHRLPDEIITQILLAADPNGFASLVHLNRKWRAVSQQSHLYTHHLSQCPSYALAHTTPLAADDDSLPRLRGIFARQVKRNLFDAYLRPRETTIKLASTSISSSSAPGGEGMQFSASPKGHQLLAYNSSRIHVLNVRAPTPKVDRELKILRRPVSACINDDGSVLAVLSSEMQVDVYSMLQSPPRLEKSVILENAPRTIAMSPGASVLAAAYEGGIEVLSLKSGTVPHGQRSVKCDAVDALAFSYDGTQLLGTTTQSQNPATVILTAPCYDPDNQIVMEDESAMWTTSILFPNTSRDCSHAILLQNGDLEEASWTFTYDRAFETFRAVRIEDLRNGTTYFTGPLPNAESQLKLLPSSIPTATSRGDLVSAAFQSKDIWIYGVPESLDAAPEASVSTVSTDSSSSPISGVRRRESNHSDLSRNTSNRTQDRSNGRVPRWRLLCDKNRNTFVAGFKVSDMNNASSVKWVAGYDGGDSLRERLMITAKGVSPTPGFINDDEGMDFVDGGRVVLLDFDYGLEDGSKTEFTIELGSDGAEALEEEKRSIETEVAIVRRRTVARNRSSQAYLLRAATTSARHLAETPLPRREAREEDDDDPLLPRTVTQNPARRMDSEAPEVDLSEGPSMEEMEALDAPYAHAAPRSGGTLRRAATAAAVNRTLNPRTADGRPIEYRRADGRREHPHESDADNWVPPPPPYQKEDPGAAPAFLSGPAVAPLPTPPIPPVPSVQQLPPGQAHPHHGRQPSSEKRPQDSQELAGSKEAAVAEAGTSNEEPNQRAEVESHNDEDIYDVSPPDSPRLPPDGSDATGADRVSPHGDMQPVDASAIALPASRHASQQSSTSMISAHTPSTPPRPVAPTLNLDIPSSSSWEPQPAAFSSSSPRERRLMNAQTWPDRSRMPEAAISGFPVSAPVIGTQTDDFANYPPAPTSAQMENLNKRISQGNPRRLSGGMQLQRKPVGAHASASPTQRHVAQYSPGQMSIHSRPPVVAPDQPLIISTPTGISGAFDTLANRPTWPQSRSDDVPLIAPVARHPRPSPGSHIRPTVERLETIYSLPPEAQTPSQAPAQAKRSRTPRWLRPRSSPLPQRAASAERQQLQTRADKSTEDARRKAWKSKMKRNEEKRKKRANASTDVASTAQSAWTDLTTRSVPEKGKERKCVVM